ncbi:MAG: hypothetical protein WCP36_03720 [Methanomicrobiales archaeon]
MVFSLKDTQENELFIVLASATGIRNKNIEVIQAAIDKDYYIIVVTTNQIAGILKKNYEKNGIPDEKIYFVDAVTKYAGGTNIPPMKNCRYISNPGNLTDMGIAIIESIKDLEGKKTCLLLDSINSMLIYIPSHNITKFIHFITNKLRIQNLSGIFLIVEKGIDPDVLSQLTTYVDEVIDSDQPDTV